MAKCTLSRLGMHRSSAPSLLPCYFSSFSPSTARPPPVPPDHPLRSRSSRNLLNENPSISEMLLGKTAQLAISRTPSLTSRAVNDQMRRLASNQIKTLFTIKCLHLVSTPKSYSVTEMISNSLPAPYSNRGKEGRQTSRFEPIGNQAMSQTLMANHRNLFKSFRFQTTELISQSLQPSQNPAKDPRGNSCARRLLSPPPRNLKLQSFLRSARSWHRHKSHLRRGGRTWYPDCHRNCTELDVLEK